MGLCCDCEATVEESAEEAERSKAHCAGLQKSLVDSEAASEDLRQKLVHWESPGQKGAENADTSLQLRKTEHGENLEGESGLEEVKLKHVQASSLQLEKLSSDLHAHLRKAGESSADQEASVQNLSMRLRSIEAVAADKEKLAAEIRAQLRHVEAGDSESRELPEGLMAKLREVVSDSHGEANKEEAFQVRLRHVEAAAVETEAASAKLQVQLRNAEASSAHLEDEVQTLRVQLRHVPQREVEHTGVQTDGRPMSSARRKNKTVLFGTEEQQSLPGSVHSEKIEDVDSADDKPEKRSPKSRIKSVDFQRTAVHSHALHPLEVFYSLSPDGTKCSLKKRVSECSACWSVDVGNCEVVKHLQREVTRRTGSAVSFVLQSDDESASDRGEPMAGRMSTVS